MAVSAGNVIGSAFVEIKPEISAFESALQQGLTGPMQRQGSLMSKVFLGAAVGIGAIATGAIAAVNHTIDLGQAAYEMGEKFGLSGQQASTFVAIGKLVGVSSDQMGIGMRTLSKQLNTTALDLKNHASAASLNKLPLQELGIASTDASGNLRDMNSVLGDVADRFRAMPDGPRKAALATQLFGRAGTDLIPILDKGSKGIADLTQQAKDEGAVMSGSQVEAAHKAYLAHQKLNEALSGVALTLGTALMPYLAEAANWLSKHLPEAINTLHGWIESHKQDIQHWAGVIKDVLVGAWNLLSSTVMGVWSRVLGPFINWLSENQGVALAFGAAIAGIFAVNKIHTWLTTATSAIQTVLKLAGVASVVGGKGGGGLLGSLIPVAGGAAAAEGGGAVAATPLALLSTVFAGASVASVAAILGAVLIPAAGMAALAWWGTNQAANNQLSRQFLQGVDVGGSVISGGVDVGSFAGMSSDAIKTIQKKLDDAGMASGDIDNELTTLAGVAQATGPLTAVQLEVFQSQWEQGNHGAGDILDAIKTNGPIIQRGVDQTASVWGGGPSSISGHASATNALAGAAKGHFGDLNKTFGITVPQINTALGLTSQQTGGTAGSAKNTHSWWDGWNRLLGQEGQTVLDDLNHIIDAFSKPPKPIDPSVMNQIADAIKSPAIVSALNNINAIAADWGNFHPPKPPNTGIGPMGPGPGSVFPGPQHGDIIDEPGWIFTPRKGLRPIGEGGLIEAVVPLQNTWGPKLVGGLARFAGSSRAPSLNAVSSTGASAGGVSVVQHFHINGGDRREVQSIIHREFKELELAWRTH